MVPDVTHDPPAILNWELPPPVMLTGTDPVIPLIVTVLDVTAVLHACPVRSVKEKAFGVVSCAAVVTDQLTDAVPTTTVAERAVLCWSGRGYDQDDFSGSDGNVRRRRNAQLPIGGDLCVDIDRLDHASIPL